MVGVAQLVELRIVIPAVVGSSPIVHPILYGPLAQLAEQGERHLYADSRTLFLFLRVTPTAMSVGVMQTTNGSRYRFLTMVALKTLFSISKGWSSSTTSSMVSV